jgi:hypothetical protein
VSLSLTSLGLTENFPNGACPFMSPLSL